MILGILAYWIFISFLWEFVAKVVNESSTKSTSSTECFPQPEIGHLGVEVETLDLDERMIPSISRE